MHEVPGVFLLLHGGLGGEVCCYGVEEGPGTVPQLHPIRRTPVMIYLRLRLLNSSNLLCLCLGLSWLGQIGVLREMFQGLGWLEKSHTCRATSLHKVLEVTARPAWSAIVLLSHQRSEESYCLLQQCLDMMKQTLRPYRVTISLNERSFISYALYFHFNHKKS